MGFGSFIKKGLGVATKLTGTSKIFDKVSGMLSSGVKKNQDAPVEPQRQRYKRRKRVERTKKPIKPIKLEYE